LSARRRRRAPTAGRRRTPAGGAVHVDRVGTIPARRLPSRHRTAMRLAVVCPHFAPDIAPTGVVITRIVEELAARGHRIDVVTALPWYEHHRVEPGWGGRPARREATAGGSITRVHPFP